MGKYADLLSYIQKNRKDEFEIGFDLIEKLIDDKLCPSAYSYTAYWKPSKTHTFANFFLVHGYKVKPNLKEEKLLLIKTNTIVSPKSTKKAKTKDLGIATPCVQEVECYLKKWNALENYYHQENSIKKLFGEVYPKNNDINEVLVKTAVLNDFYSTNIFSIYKMAKHIVALDIDKRLEQKDMGLVNDIAVTDIGDGKTKNFYSFATKYCSHHQPNDFPIYDSFVDKLLRYFRGKDGFYNFGNEELKNYRKYKEILMQFQNFYGLSKYTLKELDKYLWQLGKKSFPRNIGKKKT